MPEEGAHCSVDTPLEVMEALCQWAPSSAVGSGRNLMLGNNGIHSSWAMGPGITDPTDPL